MSIDNVAEKGIFQAQDSFVENGRRYCPGDTGGLLA